MEEEGGWKCLELKVISCRDVKASFNVFRRLSVYSAVSIFNEEDYSDKQRKKTAVDGGGGGNPEWNDEAMQFDLTDQYHRLFVKFKLCCGGVQVLFGKRSIGEVKVPLNDLIEEFNGGVRFLSYQVCSSDGKPNGVLNFSYTLKGKKKNKNKKKENHEFHVSAAAAARSYSSSHKQRSLYPSLDDIRCPSPPVFYYQPMPAFAVAHHPCPSQLMVQHPCHFATQQRY